MSEPAEADFGSVTAILKRADPLWWWLRANFKLPSLAAIASVVAGAGGWLWHQSHQLEAVRSQLEGVTVTAKTLATSDQVAKLAVELHDQGDRLDRLERNWDDAGRVAAEIHFRPRRRP